MLSFLYCFVVKGNLISAKNFASSGSVNHASEEVLMFYMILALFQTISSVIPGLNYIRSSLKETLKEYYKDFMSTDWLPKDATGTRMFSSHVYMEPCWTRTVKGHLRDSHDPMNRLYDIFPLYKDKHRVLAEGIS